MEDEDRASRREQTLRLLGVGVEKPTEEEEEAITSSSHIRLIRWKESRRAAEYGASGRTGPQKAWPFMPNTGLPWCRSGHQIQRGEEDIYH